MVGLGGGGTAGDARLIPGSAVVGIGDGALHCRELGGVGDDQIVVLEIESTAVVEIGEDAGGCGGAGIGAVGDGRG